MSLVLNNLKLKKTSEHISEKGGGGMSHKFVINTWTITNSSNKEANQKKAEMIIVKQRN